MGLTWSDSLPAGLERALANRLASEADQLRLPFALEEPGLVGGIEVLSFACHVRSFRRFPVGANLSECGSSCCHVATFSFDIAYSDSPAASRARFLSVCDREANDLAITEGPDVEEAVPHLGIAPSDLPAILDGGDHMLLVGVEHLFELDMEILERVPVLAQRFQCGFESPDDFNDIQHDIRLVELKVRIEQLLGISKRAVTPS